MLNNFNKYKNKILLGLALMLILLGNSLEGSQPKTKTIPSLGYNHWLKTFKQLPEHRKQVARLIYKNTKGSKIIKYSLVAISLKESTLGKYMLNINDNKSLDCGLFQNNVRSVLKREKMKYGKYNQIEVCQRLLFDTSYSIYHAKQELMYWKKNRGTWAKAYLSYHRGYKFKSPKGKAYSKDIQVIIEVLKRELFRK